MTAPAIARGLDSSGARRAAGWQEKHVPGQMAAQLEAGVRLFQKDAGDGGHLTVFVGRTASDGWHLSISHRRNLVDALGQHPPMRNPTWEEIRDARYLFIPSDINVAMFLPPPGEYVNVHQTTFHLWEVLPGTVSQKALR